MESFEAFGADLEFLAGYFLGLQIDILPFNSFCVRMGAGSVSRGAASAQITGLGHRNSLSLLQKLD
jgi:hypothetical protein